MEWFHFGIGCVWVILALVMQGLYREKKEYALCQRVAGNMILPSGPAPTPFDRWLPKMYALVAFLNFALAVLK